MGAGEYTRERLVRGDLAEGQGPPGSIHSRPGTQRGRRSGKAPVVLGLLGVRWGIPGFARVLLGMLPSFTDFSDFLGRIVLLLLLSDSSGGHHLKKGT